jgi:hypothetical protein
MTVRESHKVLCCVIKRQHMQDRGHKGCTSSLDLDIELHLFILRDPIYYNLYFSKLICRHQGGQQCDDLVRISYIRNVVVIIPANCSLK